MHWIWTDYVIVGILVISGLLGLLRGFIREIFSLISWVLAVWVAARFSDRLSVYLQTLIDAPPLRKAAAFCIVLFVVLVAAALAGSLIARLLSGAGLSGTDRLVGLIFGVFRGALLVAVLVLVAGLTPAPRASWWREAKLIPPFQSLALWVREQVPASWLANLNYH
jgi:membrane protein required for colicin V production